MSPSTDNSEGSEHPGGLAMRSIGDDDASTVTGLVSSIRNLHQQVQDLATLQGEAFLAQQKIAREALKVFKEALNISMNHIMVCFSYGIVAMTRTVEYKCSSTVQTYVQLVHWLASYLAQSDYFYHRIATKIKLIFLLYRL